VQWWNLPAAEAVDDIDVEEDDLFQGKIFIF
jgi:hypothetical protein